MLDEEKRKAETDIDKLIRLHEILSIQIDEYHRLTIKYDELVFKLFENLSNYNLSVNQNATFLKQLLNVVLLKEKKFHQKKNSLCEHLKNSFLKENFFEWYHFLFNFNFIIV